MKRVLIVSPHFPPVNAADMHRVRMVLPFLAENGWQAEVLAVAPEDVASPRDPWLAEGLPKEVPIHRVRALGLGFRRIPGLGTLGLRALSALAREGDRILRRGFDLVYFSTTVFEVHALGPRWKSRFGVPFAMDYQDPWVNDYYREHPEITPPGGRLKYALASSLHRFTEPRVLAACDGITSVSAAYPEQLRRRYGKIPPDRVLPFPGAARDFERLPPAERRTDDGLVHWVYVGRGGGDMRTALTGIFTALREHAPPELLARLRLHFVGTSYAAAGSGQKTVSPIAEELGVGHLVEESPDRIPYSQTLARLAAADALIVPGSDDPGYTASKIYPYLLARRPMLAVFHEQSSVVDLVRRVGGATCVPFRSNETGEGVAARIAAAWLADETYRRVTPLDEIAFEPFTDRASARELARFFDATARARDARLPAAAQSDYRGRA